MPETTHVVVDGSNIATEGRSMPSLAQLDEAVQAFLREYPDSEVTVVVDASFGHRIDPSEHQAYEEAYAAGELIAPPAGAIGRGDAFILRIAEKIGAVVFSNDSFQEFHGEHDWLFTKGRLIGGKPVPGIGWVFMPRTPVRGEKSRLAVRDAKRERDGGGRGRGRGRRAPVTKAIAEATAEISAPLIPKIPPPRRAKAPAAAALPAAVAVSDDGDDAGGGRGRRRRRRTAAPPIEPINAPLTFIQFVADHRPGSEVEGEVESFSSHGAFVNVGEARCYIPLRAMGDPPPRAAREVLTKGETRTFVVQALDAPRRGIELALPGFAHPSGQVSEETIAGEIGGPDETAEAPVEAPATGRGRRSRRGAAATVSAGAAETGADGDAASAPDAATPATRRTASRKAAAKKTAPEKAPATRTAAKKTATDEAAPAKATTKTTARRTAARTATATEVAAPGDAAPEAAAKKTAPKTTAAKKAAPAKKAAAKKAAPAKKAAAKKAAAKKAAPAEKAPAKKATADKATAKKATAKKATAKKATAKKATAKKATAKKATAKKATAKKATAKKATAKKAAAAGTAPEAASADD